MNTANRENSTQINSSNESPGTDQRNRTLPYEKLGSPERSSPPDHPRPETVYEEIDDDYVSVQFHDYLELQDTISSRSRRTVPESKL